MENRKSEPPDLSKCNFGTVSKAHSTHNVCSTDYQMSLSATCPPSPAFSSITLTPGRIRNIDQDMEALRLSRQDNPFLKQVIASRESLVESLEESESDDTNLMSQHQTSKMETKSKEVNWEQQNIETNSPPSRVLPRIHNHHDRFSILTPTPIRSFIEAGGDDSIQLMSADD